MFRKHFANLLMMVVVLLSCEEEQPLPVEIAPSASAGDDQQIPLGDTVKILGVTNTDSFSWHIVSKPAWSLSSISDSLAHESFFIPDLPGEYLVTLEAAIDSQKVVDTLKITVYLESFVVELIDIYKPFKKLVNVTSSYNRTLITPDGECPGYTFYGTVPGDYTVQAYITKNFYPNEETDEFTFIVKVYRTPAVRLPNSMQLLLNENFDAIDNSWISSFWPGNFHNWYKQILYPDTVSTTPSLNAIDGMAVLYSGTGSTTISRSLGDLNLNNYRYLEIEIAIKKFTRNKRVGVGMGSTSVQQFNSDFTIIINNLKISPLWFPYSLMQRPATCYPELNLSNKTLVFIIDTHSRLVDIRDDSTIEIRANFDISTTNEQNQISLTSRCGEFWDDLLGTFFYPRTTSFDYVKIRGSN